MKIKDEFALIQYINQKWESYPKNIVLETDPFPFGNKRRVFWFAWEFDEFRLLLMVVAGKRNGLSEAIYLIDNSQTVYRDRLILANSNTGRSGYILSMSLLRDEISKGEDLCEVVRRHMEANLKDLTERPEWYAKHKFYNDGSLSISVYSFQGGAPGLGKRS